MPGQPSTAARVDRILYQATRAAGAILIAAMFVVVFGLIIARYLFGSPVFWGEELARYLMFYMVMLGGAAALRSDQHPRLTLLSGALPKVLARPLRILVDLLVMCVLVVILWQGWVLADEEAISMTPALRWSFFWIYLALPIGAAAMLLQIVLSHFFPVDHEADEHTEIGV